LQKQHQYNFSGKTQGSDPRDAFRELHKELQLTPLRNKHYKENTTGIKQQKLPHGQHTYKHTHSLIYATVLEIVFKKS